MAFPVTLNGRTYTLADFEGNNYVDGLPDAFEDFVTQAGSLYSTTSTTSNAIGTGSKTFTVEASKPYQVGTPLRIADTAAPSTNWIDGIVTAYSGTTLTVNAVAYAGSGTKTAWSINIGGGPIAYTGTLPVAQGGTGATTADAAATNLGLGTGNTPTFAGLNVNGTATLDGLTVDGNISLVNGAWTVSASAADNSVNLDASGNLLVGKASTSGAVVGLSLEPIGIIKATRSSNISGYFNREDSDGAIVSFAKDDTTVGNIGTHEAKLTIGNGDAGIAFNQAVDSIYPWNMATNAYRDDGVDLGYSDGASSYIRFRNLYLSGGAYIGGPGAANRLDDVEEGTWTPTMFVGSTEVTYTTREGFYTKINDLIVLTFQLSITTFSGSGALQIRNLPFTVKNTSPGGGRGGSAIGYYQGLNNAAPHLMGDAGTTNSTFRKPNGGGDFTQLDLTTSFAIYATITYYV